MVAVSGLSGEGSGKVASVQQSGCCCDPRKGLVTFPDNPQTNFGGAGGKAPRGYLERVDKLHFPKPKSYPNKIPEKCGLWALVGEDEDGNLIAKVLYCGKQWCERCRQPIWNRKIARALSRAQQFYTMGYWVIRPPYELMLLLRTKKQRSAFVKKVKKALKAIGYRRGLTFIHDFGEGSTQYAFHLNVLVDGNFIPKDELQRACYQLRRLIYPQWVINRWGDKLDINYHYRKSRGEMVHTLKYCTKPTFTNRAWDETLADALYGAHYSGWWGKWDEPAKWQLPDTEKHLEPLVKIANGLHPVSGKPIVWNKRPIPFALLSMWDLTDIGNGYFTLPPIRPPPVVATIPTSLAELPDDDYRKHPNVIRRSIDKAREYLSFLDDED